MSSLRIGMVLLLWAIFSTTGGQLFGQQSKTVSLFAPPFSPNFEDVLIDSPAKCCTSEPGTETPEINSIVKIALNGNPAPHPSCVSGALTEAIQVCRDCPGDNKTSRGGYEFCCLQMPDNLKGHCRLMAQLLTIALRSDSQTEESQRKVIEAALLMVAETSEAKAQMKIARMEVYYQKQLLALQLQLVKSSSRSGSTRQVRDKLSPVYAKQNRNFDQIRSLAASSANLNRTVRLIEKKVDSRRQHWVPAQAIGNSLYGNLDTPNSTNVDTRTSDRADSNRSVHRRGISQFEVDRSTQVNKSVQVSQLRTEITELQNRLKVLTNESVKPANHLEPVFTPDQPLEPLFNR